MPEYEPLLIRLEQTRSELFARRWIHGPEAHSRLMHRISRDIENVERLVLSISAITPRTFCPREEIGD